MTDFATTLAYRPARRGFVSRVLHMVAVAKTRRDLASLDAAALEDVGITRKCAEEEARRGFWDVPQTWRRSA